MATDQVSNQVGGTGAAFHLYLRLFFCVGDENPRVFRLPMGQTMIGQDERWCQIVLPFDVVSPLHCSIMITADEATICDLFSVNGTLLNGVRITPGQDQALEDESEVFIGGVRVHLSRWWVT